MWGNVLLPGVRRAAPSVASPGTALEQEQPEAASPASRSASGSPNTSRTTRPPRRRRDAELRRRVGAMMKRYGGFRTPEQMIYHSRMQTIVGHAEPKGSPKRDQRDDPFHPHHCDEPVWSMVGPDYKQKHRRASLGAAAQRRPHSAPASRRAHVPLVHESASPRGDLDDGTPRGVRVRRRTRRERQSSARKTVLASELSRRRYEDATPTRKPLRMGAVANAAHSRARDSARRKGGGPLSPRPGFSATPSPRNSRAAPAASPRPRLRGIAARN